MASTSTSSRWGQPQHHPDGVNPTIIKMASTSTSSRWRQPQHHPDGVNLTIIKMASTSTSSRWRQPQHHPDGINLNIIKMASTPTPTTPSTLASRDEYIYSTEFTRLVSVKRKEATTDKTPGYGTSCIYLQAGININNGASQHGHLLPTAGDFRTDLFFTCSTLLCKPKT
jgi:hypothetical protein